jgi:trk system potassium uptake protein TrkA
MNIIIIGCGRVGIELASRLLQSGTNLVVVDNNAQSFTNLPVSFDGQTIEGEALNRDVLIRAGIETADGLAAVTNSDAMNAVIGQIAREEFHVPHVVVRNYDPQWRVIHESFKHQIVSSTSWGAQRIEELLYHADVRTVYSAGNGEVEFYEITVPDAWQGKKIADVLANPQIIVSSITRAGRAILPAAGFVLESCDVVHFSATMEGAQQVKNDMLALEGK